MSGPPGHPPYKPRCEESFAEDCATYNFRSDAFDYFLRGLKRTLADYPYGESVEIPDGGGIRILPTYRAFPDLPPLFIFYEVDEDAHEIVFLGLTPAWKADDLPPPPSLQ